MNTCYLLMVLFLGPLWSTWATSNEPFPLLVNTTEGTVEGVSINGTRIFKSVPFAMAPLGQNRFSPPVAPMPYSNGYYNASSLDNGKVCMQVEGPVTMSEDCLYLDIVTPSNASSTPDTFNSYEFTAKNLPLFTGFQIKIIMTGTNIAYAPKIRDLRVIASI